MTLQEILAKSGELKPSISMTDSGEYENARCRAINRKTGCLDGFDCPECLNRGYTAKLNEVGRIVMVECKCMAIRRSKAAAKRSGLGDLLKRCTFDTWERRDKWHQKLAEMGLQWLQNPDGWFYIAGTPGTGKTHFCAALCEKLIEVGMETRYMLWREVSVAAKAVVNDEEEYRRIVEPLKAVKVLYIDDLFKTGKGQSPTVGDVNLAFEIINARYNDRNLVTILSSEMTVEKIMDIDEAVGSRIYERTKGHYVDLTGKPNWRLKE